MYLIYGYQKDVCLAMLLTDLTTSLKWLLQLVQGIVPVKTVLCRLFAIAQDCRKQKASDSFVPLPKSESKVSGFVEKSPDSMGYFHE